MYSGSDAFSQPKTRPVMGFRGYERYFYPAAEAGRRFYKPGGEASDLYNQFKENYLGGSADAAANAKIYQDYAKNLFASQPNQFENYKNTGDYLYGAFDRFAQNSANAGNRAMNERAAALGYGGQGANSYLAKINADRITSNLAPAFANTTNAIAPGYQSQANNDFRETMLRLGLAQNDALTGYNDRVAARPLDVYGVRTGMLGDQWGNYNNMLDSFNKNIQGFSTVEGNNIAKFGKVWDNWWNSVYSSYGGQGSGPSQLNQPQLRNTGSAYGGGAPAQNYQIPASAWNMGSSSPYLGDVNVNPNLAGAA
jgi:hypothetical protein